MGSTKCVKTKSSAHSLEKSGDCSLSNRQRPDFCRQSEQEPADYCLVGGVNESAETQRDTKQELTYQWVEQAKKHAEELLAKQKCNERVQQQKRAGGNDLESCLPVTRNKGKRVNYKLAKAEAEECRHQRQKQLREERERNEKFRREKALRREQEKQMAIKTDKEAMKRRIGMLLQEDKNRKMNVERRLMKQRADEEIRAMIAASGKMCRSGERQNGHLKISPYRRASHDIGRLAIVDEIESARRPGPTGCYHSSNISGGRWSMRDCDVHRYRHPDCLVHEEFNGFPTGPEERFYHQYVNNQARRLVLVSSYNSSRSDNSSGLRSDFDVCSSVTPYSFASSSANSRSKRIVRAIRS
ncbi:uncharacterized protein [Watersipora subatra]|uniref:uncharacterized protein n=1 Tax=Watersipora subatra TaxID=2589382 RepID=UPI00355C5BB3